MRPQATHGSPNSWVSGGNPPHPARYRWVGCGAMVKWSRWVNMGCFSWFMLELTWFICVSAGQFTLVIDQSSWRTVNDGLGTFLMMLTYFWWWFQRFRIETWHKHVVALFYLPWRIPILPPRTTRTEWINVDSSSLIRLGYGSIRGAYLRDRWLLVNINIVLFISEPPLYNIARIIYHFTWWAGISPNKIQAIIALGHRW